MEEEGVGDRPEAGASLGVIDGDGFFTQIGGGHHKSLARIGKEQVLQRGVGQKDTEPGNAGGDFRGDAVGRTGASENDGTGRRLQQCFFLWSEIAESSRGVEIAHHDGERLSVAMLALA